MNALDRAVAAAREALDNHDYGHEIPAYVVRNLLTALDAARGEAVAYRFWDTEQDRWQWGEAACAEKDDELLYAAPPAALAVPADGMLPDALAPHAKEWYRLCERRFAADRITISGKLAEAIVSALAQQPAAAVPEDYALVKVQREERDGFWSFSDNEENFVGEECDTELDAIAAALDYYGDDLETVYVGQAKRIDKARLVRGDHIIELIGDAAGEEVGECAYDWPRLSNDECAELERIVMGYVLSKSPAGFFTVENSREYTREQAEEMLAAAARKGES